MQRRAALAIGGTMLLRWRTPGLTDPGRVAMRSGDPLPAEMVREFVRAAHADLSAVRTALATHPGLANACWDWDAGDYETALGAASHMGRRDIAGVLLEAGARVDMFTLIVLRELDLLRELLVRQPALVLTKGPHGLTFEAHARATKDPDVERRVSQMVAAARAALR